MEKKQLKEKRNKVLVILLALFLNSLQMNSQEIVLNLDLDNQDTVELVFQTKSKFLTPDDSENDSIYFVKNKTNYSFQNIKVINGYLNIYTFREKRLSQVEFTNLNLNKGDTLFVKFFQFSSIDTIVIEKCVERIFSKNLRCKNKISVDSTDSDKVRYNELPSEIEFNTSDYSIKLYKTKFNLADRTHRSGKIGKRTWVSAETKFGKQIVYIDKKPSSIMKEDN